MILIGLGANLPTRRFGAPRRTLEAALSALSAKGIRTLARSRWYSTAPFPPSDQPRYVNAVAAVETTLGPEVLLESLHAIERAFGRTRGEPNAARVVDLDLLVYHDLVRGERPILPHPRMHLRAFVLRPLRDVAPAWRHPVTGASVDDLLERAVDREDVVPRSDEMS